MLVTETDIVRTDGRTITKECPDGKLLDWQAGAGPFFFPCTDTVTYVIMEWCRQGREKLVNAGAPEEVTACFREGKRCII